MKNMIVVENTLYSLLIFWLKKGTKGNITYVLDSERMPAGIVKNLRKSSDVHLYDIKRDSNFLTKLFYVYGWRRAKLYWQIRKKLTHCEIYGRDLSPMFDIFRKYKYTLLEDGVGNYREPKKSSFFKMIIKYGIRGFWRGQPYGISDNCVNVYLTGLAEIPSNIKHKTEVLNLKELWNNKSDAEQNDILEIFNFKREQLNALKSKTIFLLTQPLSEDEDATEKEKISIYKDIVSQYDSSKVVIKTHPREKTDYSKHFKDIFIFDAPIPFELFGFIGLKIEKVITLFSTAALNFGSDVEVEWLGTYNHPKLKKRLGNSLDHLDPKNNISQQEKS